jgi:Alkylmercury lyase
MAVTNETAELVRAFHQMVGGDLAAAQASLPPRLIELHRAVLRAFLEDGVPPDEGWLQAKAGELGLDPQDSVARLAANDLVHVSDGRVVIAYPFSGTPTPHRVQLDGSPPRYAMCASDAIGMPLMARRDGVITSTDPQTGEQIRIEWRDGVWSWDPDSTVVSVAGVGGCDTAAESSCATINFYAQTDTARAFLRDHPELTGQVLGQRTAIEAAEMIFGPLLGAASPPRP